MTPKSLFQFGSPGLAALLALTALGSGSVAAAEFVFTAKTDSCVEVDGAYAPDARVFKTDAGTRLVDIPSLSVSVLIRVKTRKAVTIPPSLIQREDADGRIRLVRPVPANSPSSELSVEGKLLRFKIDKSEVLAHMESDCQVLVVPTLAAGPITDDSTARKCVHMEDKPIRETAGCLKVTTVINRCDAPVMVVILNIQHLFSGDLPETSPVVIPAHGVHALGCAWSSGATSPTTYELRAASFLSKPPPPVAHDTGSTGH